MSTGTTVRPASNFFSAAEVGARARDLYAGLCDLATDFKGRDTAERVYAAALAAHLEASFAECSNGPPLRKSPSSHRCVLSLLGGHQCRDEMRCARLPGQDHPSLWLRAGKPVAYCYQPYDLCWEYVRDLVQFCQDHDLEADIESEHSWHFPGRTVLVTVHRAGEWVHTYRSMGEIVS